MDQRVRNMSSTPSRFDKVVKREVCALITKGTRTMGFFEGEMPEKESSFLMAIKEKAYSGGRPLACEFGVCFVDTCIGTFNLAQFTDDRHCSRLRTLIAHNYPSQILSECRNLTPNTQQIIKQLCPTVLHDILAPKTEFWDAEKTLQTILDEKYFCEDQENEAPSVATVTEQTWPEALQHMLSEDDTLYRSAAIGYELAVSSLGGCLWTLRRCLIDRELLQLRKFKEYIPIDKAGKKDPTVINSTDFTRQRMVLDDITLANLDVLDAGCRQEGTLLERLDHCCTAFGRRLLKQWLSAPLCDPLAINDRLDAVTDLLNNPSLVGETRDLLKGLPDLERLLRKITIMGSKVRCRDDHPDSRAILYEHVTYSKRKIMDFLHILSGFRLSSQLLNIYSPYTSTLSSSSLKKVVTGTDDGGRFPNMNKQLDFFDNAFDHAKARKEGIILPHKGVNCSYDQAVLDTKNTKQCLEDYLQKQRKRLACRNIMYWGTGRNRYQLEIPESALARHIPDEYDLKSQRKGFRRYWTKEIEGMLEELVDAEERTTVALKDTMRSVFHSFGEDFEMWDSAVHCLAVLDCMISMATYSAGAGEMCRPVVRLSEQPFLDIRAGRHPCVVQTFTGDDFIPNDTIIGSENPNGRTCVVVTGPNMGGKSTLMRQTGLIVILAQLGCYVPAESCSLSPVDRVFTRLGASDRIMHGESTFFVELSETSVILHHCTLNSLVLLDELGRGTATYDGTAIASAVVTELAERHGCRTLFSTHYHSLVDEFASNPHISLGHMACMVENEDEDGEITFLYKFAEGACPKSYGFNAAKLADIPPEVIKSARKVAIEFERATKRQFLLRKLLSGSVSREDARQHLEAVC